MTFQTLLKIAQKIQHPPRSPLIYQHVIQFIAISVHYNADAVKFIIAFPYNSLNSLKKLKSSQEPTMRLIMCDDDDNLIHKHTYTQPYFTF